MTAEEYVKQELLAGRLTAAHIVELVEYFQAESRGGLAVDGKPGPATRAYLEKLMDVGPAKMRNETKSTPTLSSPLPTLPDGRKAVITSGFKTVNPSRPNHNGVDFFYEWRYGDMPNTVGDGGAAGWVKPLDPTKPRHPKWVVPFGVQAVAAADGVVQVAGKIGTGYRVWIDHGNGWRTGYFHLENLTVSPGDEVFVGLATGTPLGRVGHNPKDTDARHLHFELSPTDRYAPVDPAPYLK